MKTKRKVREKQRPAEAVQASSKKGSRSRRARKSRKEAKHPRRQVNLPVLLGTAVFLVIAVPASMFWHGYRVRVSVEHFQERAQALAEEADDLGSDSELLAEKQRLYQQASSHLYRYLRFHPDDSAARIQLARIADKAAVSSRSPRDNVVELYRVAVGLADGQEQAELRFRLAELLFETERPQFQQALEQLKLKEVENIDPAKAAKLRALAGLGLASADGRTRLDEQITSLAGEGEGGGTPTLKDLLDLAIDKNPVDVELAAILANLYKMDGESSSSPSQVPPWEVVLNDLWNAVSRLEPDGTWTEQSIRQRQAEASLARYRYGDDEESLARALELAPQDYAVLLTAGQNALEQPNPDANQAAQFYQRAMEAAKAEDPPQRDSWYTEALLRYARALVADSDNQHWDTAVAALSTGLEELEEDKAPAPARLSVTLALADSYVGKGDYEQAIQKVGNVEGLIDTLVIRNQPNNFSRRAAAKSRFVKARAEMASGATREASETLQKLLIDDRLGGYLDNDNGEQARAWILFGNVLSQETLWDRAADAFEQAMAFSPELPALRRAAAQAWKQAGNFENAEKHFAALRSTQQDSPAARLEYAQLLFDQARTSNTPDQWRRIAAALNRVKDAGELAVEKALLASNVAAMSGRTDESIGILERSREDNPDDARLSRALVLAYSRADRFADAGKLLREIEGQADASKDWRSVLSRADLLVRQGQQEQAIQILEQRLEGLDAAGRREVQNRLANLLRRQGKLAEARDILEKSLARGEDAQHRREVLRSLAEIGLVAVRSTGDPEDRAEWLSGLEQWEEELQALEGEFASEGSYYRARRLLLADPTPEDIEQVQTLAENILRQRPNWPPAHVLAGLAAERQEELESAEGHYRQAVRLGDRKVETYQLLAGALFRLGKNAEVSSLLAEYEGTVARSRQLSSLAIPLALRQENFEDAIRIAEASVKQRPQDPLAYVWLGQSYWMAGGPENVEKAEEAFRAAVDLAPSSAATWNSLFTYLVRSQRREDAKDVLSRLIDEVDLEEWQKDFVLAQGYAAIGDEIQAESYANSALALSPTNPYLLRWLTLYTLPRDVFEARKLAETWLANAPDSVEAKQVLARILAGTGKVKDWQRAMEYLEDSAVTQKQAATNQRLQAALLLKRGKPGDVEQAQELLEGLVERSDTTDSDRVLLANLYEAQGKIARARDVILPLINSENVPPQYLASYIQMLLKHDTYASEIGRHLNRLKALAPHGFETAQAEVDWLLQNKETNRAGAVIQNYLDHSLAELEKNGGQVEQRASVLRNAAGLFSKARMFSEAEGVYQRLYDLDPRNYPLLAITKARRGEMSEAIELCQNAVADNELELLRAAKTLAAVLASGSASPDEKVQANTLIEDARNKYPQDIPLLVALSGLRFAEGNMEEVIALNEQILVRDHENLVAMNNVASLKGEKKDPDNQQSALEMIERAIQLAPDSATLLDSKGMILFHQKKFQEAKRSLERAVELPPPDIRHRFHLALVYHKLDRKRDAEQEFEALLPQADVIRNGLTPKEKELWDMLEKDLGENS